MPAASVSHAPSRVSIRPDGPDSEVKFFEFETRQKRFGGAMGVSVVAHAAAILIIFLIMSYAPLPSVTPNSDNALPTNIVWLVEPGPGGGGGGGGNQSKEPPRKAELPGKEKLTVPVLRPPAIEPPKQQKPPDEPKPEFNIPAKTMAAGAEPLPGVLVTTTAAANSTSQGSGVGGGAGTGRGTGIGPGEGSGLGPGSGGGSGGGVYRPGSGVSSPEVVYEKRPAYTADAMRARIQGTAWVAAVVLADGSVGNAHVVRSLDSTFGLDEEAVKAVKLWKFRPGMRMGQAVPVEIVIEVSFTMR